MIRSEIKQQLTDAYSALTGHLRQMPDIQAHMAAPGKWSPAQQAEHLVKSVRPVNLAFRLPAFVLTLMFGKANRPSRSYDELVAKYKAKLASGGKASKPFVPGIPRSPQSVYRRLDNQATSLARRIDHFSEDQLDTLILPHPLLGKLTLREMLYFTIYHAHHHGQAIKSSYVTETV
ncbi:MAG: DinB family protein [Cyclobacteriaceae bacterium]|nr:DinB family protein [Cyclobacteriaceae bacterium]